MGNLVNDILLDEVSFFGYVTNKSPYDYQKKILSSKHSKLTIRGARQTGKSTVIGVKALFRAFLTPNQEVVIVAAYQRQASEVFRDIRQYVQENDFIKSSLKRFTQTVIEFDNGSRIICLPAGVDGRGVRSFSPNLLIIDEAAFVKEKAWEAIEPCVAVTKGDIILTSNTAGKIGFFYQSFQPGLGFETYHFTCYDCPGYTRDQIEILKKTKDEITFAQEYMAEFVELLDSYFPISLVKKCEVDFEPITGPEAGKNYILSVDPARMGKDETVYAIAEFTEDRIQVKKYLTTGQKPTTDIVGRIKTLHKDFNFKAIYVDSSPLGQGTIDFVVEADSTIPLFPIQFLHAEKIEMYKQLKNMMETNRFTFYHDEKIFNQLSSLQYKFTSTGLLQISAPEKGHDDIPSAFVMLTKAISVIEPEEDPFYKP